MRCLSCGSEYPDRIASCPMCGTPAGQSERPSLQVLLDQPTTYRKIDYTKREFFHLEEMKRIKRSVIQSACIVYFFAVLKAAIALFVLDNPDALFDSLFLIVIGLCIQFLRSRVAGVLLVLYMLASCVASVTVSPSVLTLRTSGTLLIFSFYIANSAFRFHKSYKEYKKTGYFRCY